jgi:hypothetical protein
LKFCDMAEARLKEVKVKKNLLSYIGGEVIEE